MSKFVQSLSASNDKIKESRAEMLAEETKIEVDKLVGELKSERMKLKNKIVNMTDLAPDNTYSLRPGGEEFDASEWVRKLHQATLDLELGEIKLKIAEDIAKEWFGE